MSGESPFWRVWFYVVLVAFIALAVAENYQAYRVLKCWPVVWPATCP